ncbi:hypothetical protein [Pantoea sp. GD03673]|uniref:hypothetical protein n=1 Tax=Pantoea sp. GD03673 TaxID=2975364 RepID=UPI00244857A1|nr:hypothetical protein [Pantoea sp. GD03673]MDH2068597.1 hypothetical protein [Pantoea sp. GD03673]
MAVNLYNEGQSVQSDPLTKCAIDNLSASYKEYSEQKSVQVTYTTTALAGGTAEAREAAARFPLKN